jgi:hypothetical protein
MLRVICMSSASKTNENRHNNASASLYVVLITRCNADRGNAADADDTACVHAGLSQGEMVKCENTTADVDCSTYISGAVSDVWAFDGTKDVWNNETDPAVKNAACCVSNISLISILSPRCCFRTIWVLCYSSGTRHL